MKPATTAGLRGAAWDVALLPPDLKTSAHTLRTADGAATTGLLFCRGGERTVACFMHPREMLATAYMTPHLMAGGVAVWNQGARSVGNDLRLEHEFALFDVAAGLQFLQAQGYERIVLVGLSGGAALYAFYNQQAVAAPERRIARTPAGRATGLAELSMPVADGFVFVSPHPGQGVLLMHALDPSLDDESDPFACDPALDPFSAANGYRRPPASSRYAPEFVARYRQAQRARVARIDAHAHACIAERQAARQRMKTQPDRASALKAAHQSIFQVWRTDADLRCWDTSLDPSDRRVGSLWGADPATSNLGSVGFGRVCTPESWLSTWSGLSSNASFERCAGEIEQPVLLVEYTGDNAVFPQDAQAIHDGIRSSDKQRHRVPGNHHGLPLEEGAESGQNLAGRLVAAWLREHG